MTDEAAFQAGLDDNPRNHDLRLVFADWLEEQGDWRAASYRWMGTHRKHPYPADRSWDWWDASLRENLDDWTALERAQKILDHMAGRGPATRPTLEILGQFTEFRLTTRLMKRWFFAAMIRSDLFAILENEGKRGPYHREYISRRDAEEALCAALQKLGDFSLDAPPAGR